jgi:hypothetical protein
MADRVGCDAALIQRNGALRWMGRIAGEEGSPQSAEDAEKGGGGDAA